LSLVQINDEHFYDKNRPYIYLYFFLRVGGSTRFKHLKKYHYSRSYRWLLQIQHLCGKEDWRVMWALMHSCMMLSSFFWKCKYDEYKRLPKSKVTTNEQNNSISFLLLLPYLFFVLVCVVSTNVKVQCVNRWVLKRSNLTFSFLSSWILPTFLSLPLPLMSYPVRMKENVFTSIQFVYWFH